MVYLLPYLQYPDPEEYSKAEVFGIAFSAYICAGLFAALLVFAIFNTWQYLIKQGKWRVFSLTMFYVLTIVCLGLRCFINVFCVPVARYFNIPLVLIPPIIKICIGLV